MTGFQASKTMPQCLEKKDGAFTLYIFPTMKGLALRAMVWQEATCKLNKRKIKSQIKQLKEAIIHELQDKSSPN